MDRETLKATVNYGDYEGSVAADRHDNHDLRELAKRHGIDVDRYFVLGVNVHIGETHFDELAKTYVSLLAVDMTAVKAGSIDYIQKYVDENAGVLAYLEFDIDATLEEVLLSFKRFNMVLTNGHLARVTEFKIEEAVDEEI